MKSTLFAWSFGTMLAALPCAAQQPAPAAEAAPLLLIYVAQYGVNVLPRIALGMDKPAVKIAEFAKCVRISVANPKLAGLAVQLQPEDLKVLVAVMHGYVTFEPGEFSPPLVLWFTTADNKALDCIALPTANAGKNLIEYGVIEFSDDTEGAVCKYLTERLHPK